MSFWYLQFFQKMNKKNSTLVLGYLKSKFLVVFGRIEDTKRHFEIN